jgi:hypothetical protein
VTRRRIWAHFFATAATILWASTGVGPATTALSSAISGGSCFVLPETAPGSLDDSYFVVVHFAPGLSLGVPILCLLAGVVLDSLIRGRFLSVRAPWVVIGGAFAIASLVFLGCRYASLTDDWTMLAGPLALMWGLCFVVYWIVAASIADPVAMAVGVRSPPAT